MKEQLIPAFSPLGNELQFGVVVVPRQERDAFQAGFWLNRFDAFAHDGIALLGQQTLTFIRQAPLDPKFGSVWVRRILDQ